MPLFVQTGVLTMIQQHISDPFLIFKIRMQTYWSNDIFYWTLLKVNRKFVSTEIFVQMNM